MFNQRVINISGVEFYIQTLSQYCINYDIQYTQAKRQYDKNSLYDGWQVLRNLKDMTGKYVVKQINISHVSNSVCDCGKPINNKYAPCCSLKCWDKKFL